MCDQESTSTNARHEDRMVVDLFSHRLEETITAIMFVLTARLYNAVARDRFLERNVAPSAAVQADRRFSATKLSLIGSRNFSELRDCERHDHLPREPLTAVRPSRMGTAPTACVPLPKAGTGR